MLKQQRSNKIWKRIFRIFWVWTKHKLRLTLKVSSFRKKKPSWLLAKGKRVLKIQMKRRRRKRTGC